MKRKPETGAIARVGQAFQKAQAERALHHDKKQRAEDIINHIGQELQTAGYSVKVYKHVIKAYGEVSLDVRVKTPFYKKRRKHEKKIVIQLRESPNNEPPSLHLATYLCNEIGLDPEITHQHRLENFDASHEAISKLWREIASYLQQFLQDEKQTFFLTR